MGRSGRRGRPASRRRPPRRPAQRSGGRRATGDGWQATGGEPGTVSCEP
ncbi:hypothetical protein D8O27_25110 [Burkholderia mallei]|uniref:Uncharacterized protein n=2 Tax=Burkholderia mallei TaxID=13373 RepID=A0AAQ0TUZ3_BURML|nr:hypothetical protein BMAA0710 [Burkholderia mallei ATCC 23344]KAA8765305.1 hypothetical protein F5D26_22835 [Burkholderia pseudomallei]RKN93360.1 hypothetical protein D8O31_24945 [Burkholderia mallei]RKN96870.1 hypothetical protein D8O03_21105 [Burkholderia mallei]RKN98097.1 hypothetical protein D8O05_23950 [Burkholderia mallei]